MSKKQEVEMGKEERKLEMMGVMMMRRRRMEGDCMWETVALDVKKTKQTNFLKAVSAKMIAVANKCIISAIHPV